MDEFLLFSLICFIIMLTFIILSFYLASSMAQRSKHIKSKYIKNRKPNKELEEREKYMMKEVVEGKIKCNQMLNTSSPYNVEKWVKEMNCFVSKPIYNQLINLKGYEREDEEHKN